MRRIIMFLFVAVLLSAPGYAADTPFERAMNLYKMNRYEHAVKFRNYLRSVKPEKKGFAYLSLGIFFLSDARLHGELSEASLMVNIDYLKKIASIKGKDRSHMVNLYMAETLLEAGRPKEASFYFSKVVRDPGVDPRYNAIAKAGLGLAFYFRGQKEKADAIWAGLEKSEDPEVLSELAAAYGRAGLTGRAPVKICERALSLHRGPEGDIPIRVIKNVLDVYARAGMVEEALGLLDNADMKSHSYEEVIDENKVIRFYDPALPGNLSALYARAGIMYLKMAVGLPEVEATAQFYLSEAYALLGMADEAYVATGAFLSSNAAPEKLKAMAEVVRASSLFRKGGRDEAVKHWDGLSVKYAKDPFVLADILMACASLGTDCQGVISRAAALAEAGEGRGFSKLNHSLGRYYLGKKEFGTAIAHMEAGRDKGNKNRIEHNDPIMLVHLAGAYYSTKQFSESLEIYFEMSKQFPAVRQIQVALQGIYSMEQKSAGDVKVF